MSWIEQPSKGRLSALQRIIEGCWHLKPRKVPRLCPDFRELQWTAKPVSGVKGGSAILRWRKRHDFPGCPSLPYAVLDASRNLAGKQGCAERDEMRHTEQQAANQVVPSTSFLLSTCQYRNTPLTAALYHSSISSCLLAVPPSAQLFREQPKHAI